jgi:hypothetical protein
MMIDDDYDHEITELQNYFLDCVVGAVPIPMRVDPEGIAYFQESYVLCKKESDENANTGGSWRGTRSTSSI